ncbi:MAG TPA: S8 family serine peptidase [Thermoanaerobaculia bacterium]|nr:S8 family serine peptidase [Thermoanaerobaculia bacterium]
MTRPAASILVLLLLSSPAAADRIGDPPRLRAAEGRHFVLQPARALSEADVAALAAGGVQVERPLADGRYLVRVRPGRVAQVDGVMSPLSAERKIFRAAYREATSGKQYARVNVLFHDDVPFEEARRVIESAGGALENAFQVGYAAPVRIPALVPSSALMKVAGDERVLVIHGPMRLRQVVDNALSAQISNVNVIREAPYGLTGQGVVLSFFELAPAEATHQEFGGRLTTHFTGGSSGDASHATHVGGTMIASGLDVLARGMAPAATLHQFSSTDDDFLDLKADLRALNVVADNNSWSYVIGWCTTPSCTGWVWDNDSSDFYGAYDVIYTAPLDTVTRTTDILFVHSAGNDAQKTGPEDLWGTHRHKDLNGRVIEGRTYCYSRDGSGNDCPATTCTSGFCETVKHPRMSGQLPDPWISIGVTASAKNVLTVGAINTDKQVAGFSSRGPSRDGRVKPEVVARGVNVYSSVPGGTGNAHGTKSGTSMSAPVTTGAAALLTEQWRRTFKGTDPGAAALKTVIIAGTQDLGNPGPDYTFGFGLLDAKGSADLIVNDGGTGRRIRRDALAQGGTYEVPVTITSPQDLRVTLGWLDPEVVIFPSDGFAAAALVNDLDVRVIDPSGAEVFPWVLDPTVPDAPATRGVNRIDTTEMIDIRNAAPGTYRVIVTATRIAAQPPQQFVLITNGDAAPAPVPCIEVNEPNDSEATAYGPIVTGSTTIGKTCQSSDVDFFTFLANASGPVSVTVTATDTPLRVTLYGNGVGPVSVDVPVNETRTATTQFNGTSGVFFVRVEPTGPIGATAQYSITPSFPFHAPFRRAVGR